MQEKMDQWINWVEYDELLAGHHNAPHNLLGLHEFGKGQVFTVYRPEAQKITVTDKNGHLKSIITPEVFNYTFLFCFINYGYNA